MNSVTTRKKLTRLFSASLAGMCLLAISDAGARALVGLDYSVMTGNTVQVVFTFDQTAVEPRTFTIDEPARIALDFGETENQTATAQYAGRYRRHAKHHFSFFAEAYACGTQSVTKN